MSWKPNAFFIAHWKLGGGLTVIKTYDAGANEVSALPITGRPRGDFELLEDYELVCEIKIGVERPRGDA